MLPLRPAVLSAIPRPFEAHGALVTQLRSRSDNDSSQILLTLADTGTDMPQRPLRAQPTTTSAPSPL